MEFVFTKKLTGLNVLEVIHKTWFNNLELEKFRKIAIFRPVFVRFVVEDTRELLVNIFGADKSPETQTGKGYVLGTHSVRADQAHHFSEEELSGKLAWANLALSIGVFDVVDSSTGETNQYVRWAGRTDYCSEEHAQRNASDTLQSLLRWEMFVIAPALSHLA
ncbi:hypothetical protein KRP22_013898 [Phytophthora ramorum]|nr:hypothetical protein KRP22_13726 [Phytophthora ramorum]